MPHEFKTQAESVQGMPAARKKELRELAETSPYLRAALSEALDEIERLEAERDERFDECNAGFVKATACLDVIARGKSIDPVKHAQRTLSELEESTNA